MDVCWINPQESKDSYIKAFGPKDYIRLLGYFDAQGIADFSSG